jgi:hypothetical protein
MRSKFIDPPESQASSQRPPALPANELSEEGVGKAILSFARGAGSGLSGLRSDFVKQVVQHRANKAGIGVITQLCNLLADGRAPPKLAPYLGSACGITGGKKSKTGG